MSPSKQHHRGPHPEDAELFRDRALPALREAVADLSWLYTHRYAEKSALKLVGDHYQFDVRQRKALQRAACSDQSLAQRRQHEISPRKLAGIPITVDGYNLLITIESALAGGVLIRGRDGCIRDMASMHGSYRKVTETLPAIRCIGETMKALGVAHVQWYFDAPVSNSGRLRALLHEEAEAHGWAWDIELLANPDKRLAATGTVVITADSWILDRAARWTNLAAHIIRTLDPPPRILDLAGDR